MWHAIRDKVRPRDAGALRYLIVGLGNPGPKYAGTRHNIGFLCLDHLATVQGINLGRKRFEARLGEGQIDAHLVVLAEPLTFMNDSGRAVGAISRWYKVPPQRILVIHDDLDLPLGRLRVRPGGSTGGHRGVESLVAHLGTTEFPRLRLGIGRPAQGDPIDYVLSRFGPNEEPVVAALCELVSQIVPCFLEQGVQQAMNAYNGAIVQVP